MPEQGVRPCNALKKDITKHTPATTALPANSVAALSHRKMPEATIATIARTAFAVSMWTSHPATVPAIAAV